MKRCKMNAANDMVQIQPFQNQHSARNELQGQNQDPQELVSLMEKTWETCIKKPKDVGLK